jgi:hypothetical protein
MNAYERPGYRSVSTPESHLPQVVSSCYPLSAQVLAAEDRQGAAVRRAGQIRWRRDSLPVSAGDATAPARLRLTIGSALVRLGQRLAGTPSTLAVPGTTS